LHLSPGPSLPAIAGLIAGFLCSPLALALDETTRAQLPQPVLPEHPEWVDLYWASWDVAWPGLTAGPPPADQAQACFAVLFTRYAWQLVPVGRLLDPYYASQSDDGFVCRELAALTGRPRVAADAAGAVGPPLFSWAEWELYRLSGDQARVRAVLPTLQRHYEWLKANRRRPGELYYFADGREAGMEGSPRVEAAREWVDLSAQQGLNARCLARLGRAAGDETVWRAYDAEHAELSALVNTLCWDRTDAFYYDRDRTGDAIRAKTAVGFWPLLAEFADPLYSRELLAHLVNEQEFWRAHLVPSLSADHPSYDPAGGGWRGAVWPTANYALVRGLAAAREWALAGVVAENHLTNMAAVLQSTGRLHTNYAPDGAAPGRPSEPCTTEAWACSAIPLLIEQVMGLEANAPEDEMVWRLRLRSAHGLRGLRFGGNVVSLEASPDTEAGRTLSLTAERPFRLTVLRGEQQQRLNVPAGESRFPLPPLPPSEPRVEQRP